LTVTLKSYGFKVLLLFFVVLQDFIKQQSKGKEYKTAGKMVNYQLGKIYKIVFLDSKSVL